MTHLDEGTILTIRDHGLVDADAHEHLDRCASCTSALAAAQGRADAVARSLRALDDGPPIDVDAAKAAVRRRLDERREAPRPRVPGVYGSLGRAALLVALASGAVYALPNSPLRGWLAGDDVPGRSTVETTADGEPAATEGVELAVPTGGLSIALTTAAMGQRVEVRWVDGDRLTVEAGADSRYQVSDGRLGVDLGPGDVRIDVPAGNEPIIVEVNGRMILQRVDGGLVVQGDVLSSDPSGIVFTVGQR